MATLEENINQAIADFDDIEAAIEEQGVPVPRGTDTSEYGNLIRSIVGGGSSPIKYVESDSSNPIYLREMESGTYILYGKFKPFNGSTGTFTFSTGMLVSIIKTTTITYVQVFYSKSNTIQYLEITDEEYTRKDAKLVEMETKANLTTIVDENSDDNHYPSAKAVYDVVVALEQELQSYVEESVKSASDNFSNALKGTASGEVIRVDDVSPIEHTVKAKVKSKNLLDFTKAVARLDTQTVVIDESTDSITFSGNYYFKIPINLPANKTVAFSCESDKYDGYYVFEYDDGTLSVYTARVSKTTEKPTRYIYIYKSDTATTEENIVFKNLQLEEGDTATEYTPYVDPSTVTVTRCGKNLFDFDRYVEKYSGQISEHTNDSFTLIHRTSSGQLYVNAALDLGGVEAEGKYITVSGEWKVSGQNKGAIRLQWYTPMHGAVGDIIAVTNTSGEPKSGIIPPKPYEDAYLNLYLYLNTDGTLVVGDTASYTNVQVEIGDKATDYEHYNAETYTPSTDGTVNSITSVSPTMTLLTDKAGVTIEAEYNQDGNSVREGIREDIKSLDNTVAELIRKQPTAKIVDGVLYLN